jgi:hypothetical protein
MESISLLSVLYYAKKLQPTGFYLLVMQLLREVTNNIICNDVLAKRAVAVNQHHDAVSGTAKQAVTNDYALRLHRYWTIVLVLVRTILRVVMWT